jgi:hypothetical protein
MLSGRSYSLDVSRAVRLACASLIVASMVLAEPPGQPGLPSPGLAYFGQVQGQLQYSIVVQALVSPGQQIRDNPWPSCGDQANNLLSVAGSGLAVLAISDPAVAAIAGVVTNKILSRVEQGAGNSEGFLAELIAPHRYATCTPVAAILPAGSTISRVIYNEGDGAKGTYACLLDGNNRMVCGAGYSGWENVIQPGTVIKGGKDQLVGSVYKNWSTRDRWASLTIIFTPPATWHPSLGINNARIRAQRSPTRQSILSGYIRSSPTRQFRSSRTFKGSAPT